MTTGRDRAPVEAPPPPDDLDPVVVQVYRGFIYLIECRWTHTYGNPTTFTRDFDAVWCGVTPDQARRSIAELSRLDLIRQVGSYELETGPSIRRRARLYLPGAVA